MASGSSGMRGRQSAERPLLPVHYVGGLAPAGLPPQSLDMALGDDPSIFGGNGDEVMSLLYPKPSEDTRVYRPSMAAAAAGAPKTHVIPQYKTNTGPSKAAAAAATPLTHAKRQLDMDKPPAPAPTKTEVEATRATSTWHLKKFESGVAVASSIVAPPSTASASASHMETIDTSSEDVAAMAVVTPKKKPVAAAAAAIRQPLQLEPVPLVPSVMTSPRPLGTPTAPVAVESLYGGEDTMDLDNTFFKRVPKSSHSAIAQFGERVWDADSMALLMKDALKAPDNVSLVDALFMPVVELLLQHELPHEKQELVRRFGGAEPMDEYTRRQQNMFVFTAQHYKALQDKQCKRPFLHDQAIQLMGSIEQAPYRAAALHSMLFCVVTFANTPGDLRLSVEARKLLGIVHDQEGVAAAIVADAPLPGRCSLAPWLTINAHTATELTWSYGNNGAEASSFKLLVHNSTARLVSSFFDAITLQRVITKRTRDLKTRYTKLHTLADFKGDPAARADLTQIAIDFLMMFRVAWENIGPDAVQHLALFRAPATFISKLYAAEVARAARLKQLEKQQQQRSKPTPAKAAAAATGKKQAI